MQRRDRNMSGGGGPDGGQHTVIVLSDDDNDEEDEALQQAIQLSLGLSNDAPHKPCVSHQRKTSLVEEDEALKNAIALSLASTNENSLQYPPHTWSESVEDEELERAIKLSLGEDTSASNIGKSRTAHHKKDHRQNLRNEGVKSRISEDRSWGEGDTFYLNRIEGLCEEANANTLSFTQILQPVCAYTRENARKRADCELMCECPSSLREREQRAHCTVTKQGREVLAFHLRRRRVT